MRTKRAARVLAASLVLLALGPHGARADHCASSIIVYSFPVGLYPNILVCTSVQQETDDLGVDPRLIWPASTDVMVRYVGDFGNGVPELEAVIDGLGFEKQTVVLRRTDLGFGLIAYDSESMPIPDGPTASGCIVAEVARANDRTAFRTVDVPRC